MTKKMNQKKENKNDKNNESNNNNEIAALKDQLLRVNSDFANFKRRVEKEQTEWMSIAQSSVLEKMLPIMDDLDRAIQACKQSNPDEKESSWLQGFELILKNLEKTFTALGVKEIDCSNGFNPDFHEALMQVDSKDHKSGEIVQVLNKGYLFKDKVLRPAKVSVAK